MNKFYTAIACALLLAACGQHEGPGSIEGAAQPDSMAAEKTARQAATADILANRAKASATDKQILFGDLHVHSTFSADAFMMSLPILQGEGAHPVADACDFARYCSNLDFWSINDHAEAITPRRWKETTDTIRQCNELAGDPDNPDVVAYLGWEWTQIGFTRDTHYGHKNVILRDLDDGMIPTRPIHAGGLAGQGMRARQSFLVRWFPVVADLPNAQRYLNANTFQEEIGETPVCADGVDTRELPLDCSEEALSPDVLYEKLAQWGHESIVIPHGTTWGLYSPPGSSWDKQLSGAMHDADRQTLIEVFSGHGNSEEYRSWRASDIEQEGADACPAPEPGFEACCWRAGEIIGDLCDDRDSDECREKIVEARANYLAASPSGRLTIPWAPLVEWGNCDECSDCFIPSMSYRPASSAQYIMAISNFEEEDKDPRRFRFGFMASSDNHTARPGTGFKEFDRQANTEAAGARDETWAKRLMPSYLDPPGVRSRQVTPGDPSAMRTQIVDFERQASFFMTGGLVAVHSPARDRGAIWDSMARREIYGTSGPRILLWFDLLNGPDGEVLPMGSELELANNPRLRVRAAGSFEQTEGCPEESLSALSPERLAYLCRGECYNPGEKRRQITRIDVVRIRPQESPDEDVADLIDDPWRSFDCPADADGCTVEFDDPEFLGSDREALYYARAIEEPTPTVNAGGSRCEYDEQGDCKPNPCYGDYRTDYDDDCLEPAAHRAWSSPIFLTPAGG
jgi:hypothetical protein